VAIEALIGFGDLIDRARGLVAQAMESEAPVLIVGELGTGRHEVAKIIHEARARTGKWLISADCKANTDEGMERKLFGCVGDAFPGVEKARPGLLELARGSSLVLDDVGTLDIAIQRQLVQAAHAGGFWPRGGAEVASLDVRFIGISCFDPTLEANSNRFDAGFLRWLGGVRIELPPLREHLEDLPMLAEVILRCLNKNERPRLDSAAYRTLLSYHWPGNLRELRSVLLAVAATARGGILQERDLHRQLLSRQMTRSERGRFPSEREWIMDGLKRNRFRRAETAQFLRLSRKTLYNKMRQCGLLNSGLEAAGMPLRRLSRKRP
jgi:two-component system, NtrC family, response regulator AtoC